jgi:transcriptional regulator with XRE-family HTH domain
MRSQATRKKLSATDARNLRTLLLAAVFEPQEIGERLAQARNEAGLTQEEAADLVGVATRSLQGYEYGDVVPYKKMRALAEVYKKPVAWLLHGDPQLPESDVTPVQLEAALERVEAVHEDVRRAVLLLESLVADRAPEKTDTRPGR